MVNYSGIDFAMLRKKRKKKNVKKSKANVDDDNDNDFVATKAEKTFDDDGNTQSS